MSESLRNRETGKLDYPITMKVEGSTYVVDWNTETENIYIKDTPTIQSNYIVNADDLRKPKTIELTDFMQNIMYQKKLTIYEQHVLQYKDSKREERLKRWKTIHLSKADIKGRDSKGKVLFKIDAPTLTSVIENHYPKKYITEKGEWRLLIANNLRWDVSRVMLVPLEAKVKNEILTTLNKGSFRRRNA
jgi:hypothetical protein